MNIQSQQAFVEVSDLIVQTQIGCEPQEQETPQNLSISIKAYFEAQKSFQTDDLTQTVNYMDLIEAAKRISTEKKRFLIETLAFEIAQDCFKHCAQIQEIQIHIRKFSTAKNCQHVGFGICFLRS